MRFTVEEVNRLFEVIDSIDDFAYELPCDVPEITDATRDIILMLHHAVVK